MVEEIKPSYPMLPVAHWWALREKFKQSIPGVVTDNYLAAALNIQPKSARTNIKPYLRTIGLIDEEGKTQDLAKAWRDDSEYPEVCKKLREELYPNELIAAVPNPSKDREAVERWFANQTGSGVSAVKRMAAFYIALSESDVSKKPAKEQIPKKQKRVPKKREIREPEVKHIQVPPPPITATQTNLPSVNINLEIHISSDATPDQIDRIFESMAKHIYRK